MSDAQDRLSEIYRAYKTAKDNRTHDLKAATTSKDVDAILANIDSLHANYLAAIDADLSATGAEIEAAYEAAKDAAKAVTQARQAAENVVDVIRKTTALAGDVAKLVQKLTTPAHG